VKNRYNWGRGGERRGEEGRVGGRKGRGKEGGRCPPTQIPGSAPVMRMNN